MRRDRRRILHRLACSLAFVALIGPSAVGVAAQDAEDAAPAAASATFQGDAARTGAQPGPAPEGAAKLAWRFQTGEAVRSSPVVADGVLYFGSNDRNFYAIDAETGTERWRFPTDGPISASAVVAGDSVYFGSGDGYVYAVATESGEQRWRFYAGGRSDYRDEEDEIADGNVAHTFDPTESGRLSPAISSSLAYADGTLFVGSNDFILHAIDPETGIERWHHGAVGASVSAAAVAGGIVAVGTRYGLVAFDTASGAGVWDGTWIPVPNQATDPAKQAEDGIITVSEFLNRNNEKSEWEVIGAPVVVDTTLYAAGFAVETTTNREGGLLLAIDVATGGVTGAWGFYAHGNVLSTPAVVDGTAYLGTDRGFFYAVDTTGTFARAGGTAAPPADAAAAPSTGTPMVEKWGVQTGADVYVGSSAAVVGDTVVVATQGGAVYALATDTGVQQWLFATEGPIWSSPAVVDGLVYIGSDDGYLYAIGGS